MSMARSDIGPSLIFQTVHGSTAYGLARADSDIDLKGIIVGPRQWYFGTAAAPEQLELSADHVHFEVRKFMRLALDANPTFVEMLYTDAQHHRVMTPSGQLILDHRDRFLSKRVGARFGGFAMGQLKRICTHRSHLLSPPTHAPTRAEFDLPDRTVIPADQLAAAEAYLAESDNAAADISPNFFELLGRERRYKTALTQWQSYQTWKKQRNPARAEMEARFGYDTKHAMHLVRLQRMGLEALQGQGINVTRSDREELLAIRDGAWSFDELESSAQRSDTLLQEAVATSKLPDFPSTALLDDLCVTIIERELVC